VPGQLGHALLTFDSTAHDVPSRGIREGTEEAIEVGWSDLHVYNHTVVWG
jgi:hypothetical protein